MQPAVDLSLVPVTLQLPGALQAFVLHILAVPHLPARVPLPSLARLAADLPLLDVLRCIDPVPSTPHLLANLIALSARRVPQLKNAAELSTYLDTLAKMQDALPRSTFEGALEGTAGSTAVPDVHLEQSSSSRTVTDAATHKRLSGLVAPSHLTALMTASTRYSSSRPALTRFLVSTLEAWPASARDRVFSATLFGSGPPNGLVRELWRGWVRGGPLAKAIGLAGHGGAGGARAAVATIDSAELAEGWGPLLLLVELYSRVLLTLGDDEFRPPASAPGSSAASAPSRNPLTLDEIVTFSALLRTMSFSLYWLEGSSGLPDLSTRVPGFRLTRMELRSLFTNLLRQIHARDARKRFAPEGHWLMTSEMDLNSFIQTVMLEEDELAEPLSNAAPASDDWEMHDEFDDAEEDLPVSSRLQALRRAQEPGSTLNARQLAFLSPRLGVLNNIPFTIPFELRVEIFRQFIYRDHERRKRAGLRVRHTRTVRIRRSEVAHDGFLALNPLGAALKDRVLIEFIDDWGNVEAGIDGGGLFKEFLTSLISQAFDTNRGLWLATEQQELYPNPHAYAREPEQLEWYKFLGRVLGKALYMGILVDIKFARFFLSKWLGRQGYLDDLASLDSLDPVMYRGLLYLKNYDGDVEADLALNFTVQSDELGHVTSHDLIPGGSNIPVTRENRLSYIYRVSHYRLTGQISRQCDAFFSGLSDIIDPRWLRILDVDELKVLVCGTEEPIDLVRSETKPPLCSWLTRALSRRRTSAPTPSWAGTMTRTRRSSTSGPRCTPSRPMSDARCSRCVLHSAFRHFHADPSPTSSSLRVPRLRCSASRSCGPSSASGRRATTTRACRRRRRASICSSCRATRPWRRRARSCSTPSTAAPASTFPDEAASARPPLFSRLPRGTLTFIQH